MFFHFYGVLHPYFKMSLTKSVIKSILTKIIHYFLRLKIYLRVPRLSRSPRGSAPPPWAPPAPRWWPEGSLSTVLFLSIVVVLVDFIVPLRDCRSSKVEKLASSRLLASSNLICLAWSEKIWWRSNMIIVKIEIEKGFFLYGIFLSLDGHTDERN